MKGIAGRKSVREGIDFIKDPHIKKLHEIGIMELKHPQPTDIFERDCPQSLVDRHREVMAAFGNYLSGLIDEACKRDNIKSTQPVRYRDSLSGLYE